MAARAQKPLELILARNLLTSLSTPAFLVDEDAALVFYNEAAGALLGRPFEDVGRMSPRAVDLHPRPVRRGRRADGARRPAHHPGGARRPACARGVPDPLRGGSEREIASSAFPIVASEEGSSGAMVLFWPTDDGRGEESR